MNWIAEQLLKLAFYLAGPNQRGANIRWTVQEYFQRFKFCPSPTKLTIMAEYHPTYKV